jgi:tetratricopeptide (TPR) repeat protein
MKKKYKTGILLIIPIYVFFLYGNTLDHNYALDDDFVTKNAFVNDGLKNIDEIFTHGYFYGFNKNNEQIYRPITLTSFLLEYTFFGKNPQTSHLINVLLYALTIIILFLLLAKLFDNYNYYILFFVVLLYAAHPIHTEVVASIKNREDLLSGLFMFSSAFFVIKYKEIQSVKCFMISLFLFLLALLSKEVALTFIAIIPLLLYYFSNYNFKKIIVLTIPFIIIGVFYLLFRNVVMDDIAIQNDKSIINNTLYAADGFGERYATSFFILGYYLKLLFFPHPLSWDYSYPQISIIHWTNPLGILSLGTYLLIFAYAIWGLKNKNKLSFAIFWYLITLSITSNLFILIGSTMAERFLFIPSLGYCIFIVFMLNHIFKKYKKKQKTYTIISGVIILIIYSGLTINRNKDWKNQYTLFKAGVEACPNSARCHMALGAMYEQKAKMAQDKRESAKYLNLAIDEYKQSIALYPEYGQALYNYGVVLQNNNQFDKAEIQYRKVIESNPQYIMAYNNLGSLYYYKNQFDSALYYFNKMLKIDSTSSSAYLNIGTIYHRKGSIPQAIRFYLKALQYEPNKTQALKNISVAYRAMNNEKKALQYENRLMKSKR